MILTRFVSLVIICPITFEDQQVNNTIFELTLIANGYNYNKKESYN